MTDDSSLATQLLRRVRDGEAGAQDALAPLFYDALRGIASEWMERQPVDHTLQPTALVHEAWMKLFSAETLQAFADRGHFLKAAASAMRSVLVDHARARGAVKRGSGARAMPLDAALHAFDDEQIDVVELSDAIERLGDYQPELARIVELRYFAGLSIPDVAEVIGVSTPTVDRRWRVAKLWLKAALEPE